MKIALTAVALVLSVGIAQAQDLAKAAEHMQSGEGTVGAMQAYTAGAATSPDDVLRQQRGTTVVAQKRPLQADRVGVKAVFYAPGTVGAAPGSADGR